MSLDEHQRDDEGEHDEDECELCIERNHSVDCTCRCGKCCSAMVIEVSLRDAKREPRIAKEAGPIYDDLSGSRELVGYLLNGNDGPCIFLDRESMLCTIHDTRPLACRVFNCDTEYPPSDTRGLDVE